MFRHPTSKMLALLIIIESLGVAWLRPWLDSVAIVTVSVATEKAGEKGVYRAAKLFDEETKELPEWKAQVDLSRYAEQLVKVTISSKARRRWMKEATIGTVACRLTLLTPEGASPLEFISWQQGRELGLHLRALGPVAVRLAEDDSGYAFPAKGDLWRAIKVPEKTTLALHFRPVLSQRMGRPAPYIAASTEEKEAPPLPPRRVERPPDVFLYCVDALRPDHLGCYGYPRPTSPNIDAFARQAVWYEQASAASTWTRPSIASLLTGLPASVHGAIHEGDALARWPRLLPEVLQEAGYATYCLTTNGMITNELGFNQGYDEFVFLDQAQAQLFAHIAATWLAATDPDRPLFMYLHTFETHAPWIPQATSLARFDRGAKGRYSGTIQATEKIGVLHPDLTETDVTHLLDLYDARVWEADQAFAEFLAVLKKAGRYDNAIIIFFADHGEAFGEHQIFTHGWSLNRELLQVPLLVKYPQDRAGGSRVRNRVSLLDVAPTVLSLAGLSSPAGYRLPGRELKPDQVRPGRRIFAETSKWDANTLCLAGVVDEDGYKLVMDTSVLPRETATRESLGLWDTTRDVNEITDLSGENAVRASYDEQLIAGWLLQQRAWRYRFGGGEATPVKLSDTLRRKLQNLGYLKGKDTPVTKSPRQAP